MCPTPRYNAPPQAPSKAASVNPPVNTCDSRTMTPMSSSPRTSRAGMKNLSGSSRYALSASFARPRSASSRCGRRMSRPKAVSTTAKPSMAVASRKIRSGIIARGQSGRTAGPPGASIAPLHAASGLDQRRDRSPEGAARRAGPAPGVPSAVNASARVPGAGRRRSRWRCRREAAGSRRAPVLGARAQVSDLSPEAWGLGPDAFPQEMTARRSHGRDRGISGSAGGRPDR